MLLVIGLSCSGVAAGATLRSEIGLTFNKHYDKGHRSVTSQDFQAFLDTSLLSVEQINSAESATFTVTITNVSTGKIAFTAVSGEPTYCIDLNKLSSGEYRIEIETEPFSLLGSFTL